MFLFVNAVTSMKAVTTMEPETSMESGDLRDTGTSRTRTSVLGDLGTASGTLLMPCLDDRRQSSQREKTRDAGPTAVVQRGGR
jgi:hypothetical protein